VTADRKRVLLAIALAVAATAAVVVLIGQAAHFGELAKRLREAAPGWLVVCAAGELVAYAGYIAAYQAMAQVSGGPRLAPVTAARVVGLAFGAFSVATAVGGLSVDFWALREAGEPAALASARVIAFETLRWAVMAVVTCIAAVAVLAGVGHHIPWVVPAGWLALAGLCFAGGIWVSAPARRERFGVDSGGRLRRALGVAVTALVFIRQLRASPPGMRARAIGGSGLFWLGELGCAWAAVRSFGPSLSLAPLVVGYATGYLSTGLPLPFGGSGGVDAAMTGGFVLAGAPLSGALVGAVVFRVFSFWAPALIAALSVTTVRGLRDRLLDVAERRRQVS